MLCNVLNPKTSITGRNVCMSEAPSQSNACYVLIILGHVPRITFNSLLSLIYKIY